MSESSLPLRQRAWLAARGDRSLAQRSAALHALLDGLERHESALLEALRADLGKSPLEAYSSEIQIVRQELRYALRHLKDWMKPQRRRAPVMAWPAQARVTHDPCGSVLIIGPWNYPVQLLLTPLVGALAAGNCAVLKPSELAPSTSAAIAKLMADCFPPEEVTVIEGGAAEAESLATEPFDHIFFTGSSATGRKILAAAAPRLVPVTLELGGKCPVLVFPGPGELPRMEASLDIIARRIAWGKYLNAGQTCVAPDYILVHVKLFGPLVAALGRAFDSFGQDELARMVNRHHFDRVSDYIPQGRILYGGDCDESELRIGPTVLGDVPAEAAVMHEEIFGPVLPVVACDDLQQALKLVRKRPAPLAVYGFTEDRAVQAEIAAATQSGGVCFNDTVLQIVGAHLSFGGVGESGMGRYRGRASFETFSQQRSFLTRPLRPDFKFRYPPPKIEFTKLKKIFRFLERF